jgi:guanylate kinase
VPHQPVEDGGRPFGAAARRARELAAPLNEAISRDGTGRASERQTARGRLVVVTGPSGAGKGTLIRRLVRRRPDLEVAVSATTRPRREGEVDGRDYHFLDDPAFDEGLQRGDFLEHVPYVSGHRYGTLHAEVERIVEAGRTCILELETAGARRVKELRPETVTVFVAVPSFAELERRLRDRATESAGEIEERLELARQQTEEAREFDHVVVNDDVERAVDRLDELISESVAACASSAAAETPGQPGSRSSSAPSAG